MTKDGTNVTATKVYFPDEKSIKVHQSRVQMCPFNLPAGYYWYGQKRTSPGRPPKWVEQLLTKGTGDEQNGDAPIDQLGQDSPDENDCTDVTQEEVVMPVQRCDGPTLTSQPVQRTRTRVIKPPARYS